MSSLSLTDDLFFNKTGMNRSSVEKAVDDALRGADDGELFLEYRQSESFSWDDGKLKNANFDTTKGFGLRSVRVTTGYAHAVDMTEKAIRRAGETVRAVQAGRGGIMSEAPIGTNRHLYEDANPLLGKTFEDKIQLLQQIDSYVRAKDPRVHQVSVSLAANWQAVQIIAPAAGAPRIFARWCG